MPKKLYLGKMLLDAGFIDERQLNEGLELQESTGRRIGDILVEKGYITQDEMMRVLENQHNIPYIDLDHQKIDPALAKLLPVALCRRNRVVPIDVRNNVLYLATEDPKNFQAIDECRISSKMDVQPMLASGRSITSIIDSLYGNEFASRALLDFKKEVGLDEMVSTMSLEADSDVVNAPIVRLVNALLEQAVGIGASDIHIEPLPNEVRIRMRVDGALSSILKTPLSAASALLARLKIMGNLNIAEKRLPQDGRFDLEVLGNPIDVRLSTLPTVHGEKAVLRLLDRSTFFKPREQLGFSEENLKKFDNLLTTPHGIILVTGPTGSGKSTTLYTMLSELNRVGDNIVTVEDPVEYMISGLNQVQINPKAGMDFSTSLRSILRQDPDIIMIGEIRDTETVDIAIRAAITGHLVLSTIHTNDAISTIYRLIDMNIPPYMVAASLVGVISQRLMRTICPNCKQSYIPAASTLELAGFDLDNHGDCEFYHGIGCNNCNNTGYKGRVAVHEVLVLDNALRDMIHQNMPLGAMYKYAINSGMSPIRDSALKLVIDGKTTLDELISITHGVDTSL